MFCRKLILIFITSFVCLLPVSGLPRAGGIVPPSVAAHSHSTYSSRHNRAANKSYKYTNKVVRRTFRGQSLLFPYLPLYKELGIDLNKHGAAFLRTYLPDFFVLLFYFDIVMVLIISSLCAFHAAMSAFYLPLIGLVLPPLIVSSLLPLINDPNTAGLYDLSFIVGIDVSVKTLMVIFMMYMIRSNISWMQRLSIIQQIDPYNSLFSYFNGAHTKHDSNKVYKAADMQWDKWIRKAYISLQQAISVQDISCSEGIIGQALRDSHCQIIAEHKQQGIINKIEDVMVRAVYLLTDGDDEKLFRVVADMRDYKLSGKTGVVEGSREFTRVADTLVLRKSDSGSWYIYNIIPA